MPFSRQILVGLAGGILTGLFFGEKAAALGWAADGFVKLLQMMVLPYMTVSIVAGLGSLQYSEVRTLGLRTAAVIGGLWILAISFAFLIPLTFPSVQNASFFSSSLVERRPAFNFVDLYVPSNPFYSLANNIVPAVVLFSLVLGVALVGVEGKERLLDVLKVAKEAISRATRLVTRLTPYGLFAIAANAAGTLDLDQVSRLQVYLVAYVAVALLVSLWVLPGLVAALTPIRASDMLRESQAALITAFIAGDLFIVLPSLMQASQTLLDRIKLARMREVERGRHDHLRQPPGLGIVRKPTVLGPSSLVLSPFLVLGSTVRLPEWTKHPGPSTDKGPRADQALRTKNQGPAKRSLERDAEADGRSVECLTDDQRALELADAHVGDRRLKVRDRVAKP